MGLLDKIRQEASAPTVKVPPRNDLLAPPAEDSQVNEAEPDAISSEPVQQSQDVATAYLEEQLAKYAVVSDKKVGVRLESEILEELQEVCRKNDITIETLLEAFYVTCKSNDSLMRRVIKEAQARIGRRTEAGNIRSLITKSKNLRGKKD